MDFVTALDTTILWRIQELLQSPAMDRAMAFISRLGDWGAVWILLALVLLVRRSTRRIGLTMVLAMGICFLVGNLGLKPLIARPRPLVADPSILPLVLPPAGDPHSFPSGHAMSSMAAATAIGVCRRRLGGFALILAALISFSRLYLMLHYPTDVIAGVVIGVLGGLLAHFLVDRFWPTADSEHLLNK